MAHLDVIDPGFRTTLQDLGRYGLQRFGVPVSGALDAEAMRAANIVADNPPELAALEVAITGPSFRVEAESMRVAAAGRGMALDVAGRGIVPALQSVTLARGERLRVIASRDVAVGYLAVTGGFAVPAVLGSRATTARVGLGGFAGRPLMAGDRLPLSLHQAPAGLDRRGDAADLTRPERLRVLMAAPDRDFADTTLAAFLSGTYAVSPAADRMGLRLIGQAVSTRRPGEGLSEALAPGAIQIPGDGQPILLLADRQTTGGYPRIAHVIAADLAAAGRLRPGDAIRFEAVDLGQAAAARRARAALSAQFAARVTAIDAAGVIDAAKLAEANLVSGVVSGDD